MRLMILTFACWTVMAGSGCASSPSTRFGDGSLPPPLKQEEVRLISQRQNELRLLEQKGAFYSDTALETYLAQVGERMIPPDQKMSGFDYRFRIIRTPSLVAFAEPTGDTVISTGMLVFLKSEAELSWVFGHEVSHIFWRDNLYGLLDFRKKGIAAGIADLIITPALATVGGGGDGLATLAHYFSFAQYRREHEARADRDATEQTIAAGYNPYEGLNVFRRLTEEEKKYGKGSPLLVFRTHPTNHWRETVGKTWLESKGIRPKPSQEEDIAYLAATRQVRLDNARLNIQLGYFIRGLDNLKPLSAADEDPEVLIALGDAYRSMAENPRRVKRELNKKSWSALLGNPEADPKKPWETKEELIRRQEKLLKESWVQKSRESYQQVLKMRPNSPEAHRGLGLLLRNEGSIPSAALHLTRYLDLAPKTKDRRFIQNILDQLEESKEEVPTS